jgi:hypothetical protein
MAKDNIEADRKAAIANLPRWYSPWLHLTATLSVGVVAIMIALWQISAPRVWEFLAVPIVFVLANYFEWRVHKSVLHKRRGFPWHELFDRHTPVHHHLYREHDMAIRDAREFRVVLIPAIGVLGAVLSTTPVAALVSHYVSANAGFLVMLTAALYMVGYEVSHLLYHLPKTMWLAQMRIIVALRAHHARHHRPENMQSKNFNVTIPLFDWIMGTLSS